MTTAFCKVIFFNNFQSHTRLLAVDSTGIFKKLPEIPLNASAQDLVFRRGTGSAQPAHSGG
jgi:hypothetical protein